MVRCVEHMILSREAYILRTSVRFVIFLMNVAVQADDIQNEANELLRIRDYLFKELAQKTGQPVEQV